MEIDFNTSGLKEKLITPHHRFVGHVVSHSIKLPAFRRKLLFATSRPLAGEKELCNMHHKIFCDTEYGNRSLSFTLTLHILQL
jgi:hypothetical protein